MASSTEIAVEGFGIDIGLLIWLGGQSQGMDLNDRKSSTLGCRD